MSDESLRATGDGMTVLLLDPVNASLAPLAEALGRQLAPRHEWIAAAWAPSHVRPEVRAVLDEEGVPAQGLRARGLGSVAMEEVDLVVAFTPDEGRLRVPATARRLDWRLPDPSSAPPSERLEAYRAARDEIERRLRALVKDLA